MEIKDGYKQTEIGIIPSDWVIKELNQLTNITRLAGYEYSSLWEETSNGEIIALRGFNIGQNRIIEKEFVRISNKLSMRLIRSRLFKGDVIYPCVGTIGNAVVIEEDNKYHIQQNIAKITPVNNKIDSEYLAYYLMSNFGIKEIEKFNGSSSQPNILVGSLRKYLILTPTLKEQTAIATALSDTDVWINSLEQLLTKKRQIKQGAMQELLQPKEGWEVKKFNEVFMKFASKSFQINSSEYSNIGKYPIVDQGKKEIVGFCDFEEKVFKCEKNGIIIFGDHTRILKYINFDFVVGADGTQLLSSQKNYNLKFLFYLLLMKEIPNTGYNRHFKFLLEIVFKLPHITEQTRIATILSDMDEEIGQLESKLEKAKQLKQGMMQELLTGKTRLV